MNLKRSWMVATALILALAGGLAATAQDLPLIPDRLLVAVNDPAPGTAARLLSSGIMVVRDMEGALLLIAGPEDRARLDGLGLRWEVLDRVEEGKTYYTVTGRNLDGLREMGPAIRVLHLDQHGAVVEASPEDIGSAVAAGIEVARVFLRPIRPAPEIKPATPALGKRSDPLIQAMVDSVSGSTIDAHVQRMQDFRTRLSSSDSCQAAANWIKARFESYGIDSVYFHHWSSTYKDNVVAVLPGKAHPEEQVVIGGHYDSYTSTPSNCPGADDNASGTACVLECARVLSRYQFDKTLVFIAFCGEEQGLLGSEAYAAMAEARGDQILGMVSVDMIGYKASGDALDLDIIKNTSSQWMRDLVMTVAPQYVPELPAVDGSLPGGASSDHASFWAHGYDALLFFEDTGSYSPYIHTTSDIVGLSYNSPTLARGSVKIAVAVVATMAEPFVISIDHTPLADTADTLHPYRVAAEIVAAAALVPDSLLLSYATGQGFSTVQLTTTGVPHEYEAYIPAQPAGTWVRYYLAARDVLGNRVTAPPAAPDSVYRFFVGPMTTFFADQLETAGAWSVGAPDDQATTGIWERCDPNGTWSDGTMVQPEDDHTAAPGVMCYVTGNSSPGAGQGDNDVDGGKTTLFSPTFDLSDYLNAQVHYYRWYTNDTGSSPGTDPWAVDVSSDGGTSWVPLETLGGSDRTWRLVERRLPDYIPLTSQVKFRFVARDDYPGSIVEAGIDDFSLTGYFAPTSVAETGSASAGRLSLAQNVPNPFNPQTEIGFTVPAPGQKVTLRIFDVRGREMATLLQDEWLTGSCRIRWDGQDGEDRRVPSGVYFYQLQAGSERLARKMVLME